MNNWGNDNFLSGNVFFKTKILYKYATFDIKDSATHLFPFTILSLSRFTTTVSTCDMWKQHRK